MATSGDSLPRICFVCEGERFETVITSGFRTRCSRTFFEQFLTDRWPHATEEDAIVISTIAAAEFRKILYFLDTGLQWPAFATMEEVRRYLEATRYCCLHLEEVFPSQMLATSKYLYIPPLLEGDGNVPREPICMPLDTQIKVIAGDDLKTLLQARSVGDSGRPEVVEHGNMSFITTSLGVFMVDALRGSLLLSEHGVSQELGQHFLLKKKKLVSAVTTDGPLSRRSCMLVELETRRSTRHLFLIIRFRHHCTFTDGTSLSCGFILKPCMQFSRGRLVHLKDGGVLFLESFPQQSLHIWHPTEEALLHWECKVKAPKEADDIVARQQRKGGGSIAAPPQFHVQDNWPHGKGNFAPNRPYGKGHFAPLRTRGPLHAGSCLSGQDPQDIWVVERSGQRVILIQSFDGRVAICQLGCSHGPVELFPWGHGSAYSDLVSYKRRKDVPRACTIEGVLPIGSTIYVFHTSTPKDPLKLWQVDVPTTGNVFFLRCMHASNPKGKGRKGSSHIVYPAKGSWMNYWHEGKMPLCLPKHFVSQGRIQPDPLVAVDASRQDVEVVRFRRSVKGESFIITHTLATPPETPSAVDSLGAVQYTVPPLEVLRSTIL